MRSIVILYFIFQIKHFLCEYVFRADYMGDRFRLADWIAPLSLHCYIHALSTMIIVSVFGWQNLRPSYCLMLASIDFTLHFIFDRIASNQKLLGYYDCLSRYETRRISSLELGKELLDSRKKESALFWINKGINQFLHNLTYILIIYLIIN